MKKIVVTFQEFVTWKRHIIHANLAHPSDSTDWITTGSCE